MDTLSNVDSRRDGNLSPYTRLTSGMPSNILPVGVSVENTPMEAYCWYVLRASYHREQKAYDWLTAQGIEAYLPFHEVEDLVDGKRTRNRLPLIPNLLFVHTSLSRLDQIIHSRENPCLSYYLLLSDKSSIHRFFKCNSL